MNCDLHDFIKEINESLETEKPLDAKFELAELVQPNIIIRLPAPKQQQTAN